MYAHHHPLGQTKLCQIMYEYLSYWVTGRTDKLIDKRAEVSNHFPVVVGGNPAEVDEKSYYHVTLVFILRSCLLVTMEINCKSCPVQIPTTQESTSIVW